MKIAAGYIQTVLSDPRARNLSCNGFLGVAVDSILTHVRHMPVAQALDIDPSSSKNQAMFEQVNMQARSARAYHIIGMHERVRIPVTT
jgi:hypothetical protein